MFPNSLSLAPGTGATSCSVASTPQMASCSSCDWGWASSDCSTLCCNGHGQTDAPLTCSVEGDGLTECICEKGYGGTGTATCALDLRPTRPSIRVRTSRYSDIGDGATLEVSWEPNNMTVWYIVECVGWATGFSAKGSNQQSSCAPLSPSPIRHAVVEESNSSLSCVRGRRCSL